MSSPPTRLDRWLTRLLLVLISGLLAISTFVAWTVARIIHRVETTVVKISDDLSHVTATASGLAHKVDDAIAKIESLESKAKDAVEIDEMRHMIDEFVSIKDQRRQNEMQLSGTAEDEIDYLLHCVRDSGCRFGHDDDIRSAGNYYLRLYSKYKVYEDALTSAEQFIDTVATKTIGGNAYFIELPSGDRQALASWLTEQLRARRQDVLGSAAAEPRLP